MVTYQFALTRLGLPVFAHDFGQSSHRILILGGVHGNEPEGVVAALGLIQAFNKNYNFAFSTTVIPFFNLEGCSAKARTNSAGIDLNRNLPTNDWSPVALKPEYQPGPFANSEPENQALTLWIEKHNPLFV